MEAEATSAVNEPHPDDEADLFFGGDGEEEAGETTPAPDPADFNPETGKFDEPQAQAAPETPDPTPAVSDGATGSTTEPSAEEAAKANAEIEAKQAQEQKLRDMAATETEPAGDKPDDTALTDDEAAALAKAHAEAEGEGASGKQSGSLEREYIVFQRVPLTERALKHLLSQIEDGKAAEPRLAYFELHRCEARNVNGAVAEAYTKHQKALGEKADLAAVSARSFQEKHVEPRKVVESTLSIT